MIMAGETGGSIVTSLRRLAEYYQERDKLVRKVRGAMAYPAFVVGFIIVIVVVLMTLIVPRFQIMFDTFQGELPLFTRAFMGVYHGIVNNLIFLLIGLVLLLNNNRPDPFRDLRFFLEAFAEFIDNTTVAIGITRMDEARQPSITDYHEQLEERHRHIPIFEVDARDQGDVSLLVEALLYSLDPGLEA